MLFRRLIAFPESRRIFKMHLAATPFLAMQWTVVAMIPALMRCRFRAGEWQTLLTTLAIPMMLMLSLFWNELYRRASTRRYLGVLWLLTMVPLAGLTWCYQPSTALIFILISAAGFGAMTPISGDIMRSCYPPDVRSQAFSYLQVVAQITIMVGTYLLGRWLDHNPDAFRQYLPMGVLLLGVGMWMLSRVSRQSLFLERHQHKPTEPMTAAMRKVARNAWAVFAEDRDFRRYETGFFVYGCGWMIGTALLPFICVDKLKLSYEEIAISTQVVFQLALIVMFVPVGGMMDRHGPIRMATWAFAWLMLYPLGLIFVRDVVALTCMTVVFGIGITAVNLAWTIGPITLARDASQAPYYLAIHATMVGFRALFGQLTAVAIYRYTGSFTIPLALAAALFFAGSLIMGQLDRDRRRRALEAALRDRGDRREDGNSPDVSDVADEFTVRERR